jgi:hypothetical protein
VGVREDVRGGEVAAVRLAGGAPVDSVLVVEDPRAWLALDEGARATHWYDAECLPRWEQTAPLAADLTLLDASRLALALCHRDGRTRESAVGRAARCPELLPLIVIRCADWAAPVRERARLLLREALDVDTAVILAPLILLVGRRDRGKFATELLAGLLRRAGGDRLAPLLASSDRSLRRFAHRVAVDGRLLSAAELARAAARDEDAVVQSLCADAALAAVDDYRDEVIEPLLAARGPRVRSAGVTALRRAGRPGRAVEFLGDRSGLVRACARYVVRQHGIDPLPWYRERCADAADPGLPPGAAIGLAECGERADAELLWPLITHPAPAVRARAVAGLRHLDAADVRRLWPLLEDPAPGVVREVTETVLPSVTLMPEEWLAERLGAGRPRHVRLAAFRLSVRWGGAVRQRALLALRDDPDDELRERAARAARR